MTDRNLLTLATLVEPERQDRGVLALYQQRICYTRLELAERRAQSIREITDALLFGPGELCEHMRLARGVTIDIRS
jgi:hypothetical protein